HRPPPIGIAAHDHRPTEQARVGRLLDGGEEGIHIDVQDQRFRLAFDRASPGEGEWVPHRPLRQRGIERATDVPRSTLASLTMGNPFPRDPGGERTNEIPNQCSRLAGFAPGHPSRALNHSNRPTEIASGWRY